MKEVKESNTPKLIVPSHGRGGLLPGGKRGHRGGSGRPPSVIRAACREGVFKALPFTCAVAQGKTPVRMKKQTLSFADQSRALNSLIRVGFNEPDTLVSDQVMKALAHVFADFVPNDKIPEVTERTLLALDDPLPTPKIDEIETVEPEPNSDVKDPNS